MPTSPSLSSAASSTATPPILVTDISSNLLPKLALFHPLLSDEGASPNHSPPKELAALVSVYTPAFGYSTAARLASALDLLCSLFVDDNRKVIFALRHFPHLRTNDPKKVLAHNIAILRYRGLDVIAVVEKAPVVLVLSPERLGAVFHTVEKGLGIDNASIDGYHNALYLTVSMFEETFKNRLGMLESYRFSNPSPLLAPITSHYHVPLLLLLLLIPLFSSS